MLLKGSELAILVLSSASLVGASIGITSALIEKNDKQQNSKPLSAVQTKTHSQADSHYELWQAYQACQDELAENDSYKFLSSFIDNHSSHYDKKSNTNKIFMQAEVYLLDKKGQVVNYQRDYLKVQCLVSAKTNALEKMRLAKS